MKTSRRKIIKKTFIFCFTLLLFLAAITFYFNQRIINSSKEFVYDQVDELPKTNVGLLLGTSPKLTNGQNNWYFTYRIDAAEELYKKGKINYIIASGDHGREEYNEPEAMKNALIERGIPAEKIFLDYAGFRTLDSVLRCKEIFSQNEITVISQKFHNERAVFIAHENGMTAYGFNAKDVNKNYGFKTNVREYFARVKVFIDILTGKEPKYYGAKIRVK